MLADDGELTAASLSGWGEKILHAQHLVGGGGLTVLKNDPNRGTRLGMVPKNRVVLPAPQFALSEIHGTEQPALFFATDKRVIIGADALTQVELLDGERRVAIAAGAEETQAEPSEGRKKSHASL